MHERPETYEDEMAAGHSGGVYVYADRVGSTGDWIVACERHAPGHYTQGIESKLACELCGKRME